jgi:hypothetical protein
MLLAKKISNDKKTIIVILKSKLVFTTSYIYYSTTFELHMIIFLIDNVSPSYQSVTKLTYITKLTKSHKIEKESQS